MNYAKMPRMPALEIKKYPNEVLREACAKVEVFDEKLERFLQDMRDTMYVADGIGLAAPQVGETKRIAVVDVSDNRDQAIELINPEIISQEGSTTSEEGCLSIPGYRDSVKRSKEIKVKAQDRHGKEFELSADGILAICIQHEIDHLDGVLFIDRLSRLKRELFRRWFKKQQLQEA